MSVVAQIFACNVDIADTNGIKVSGRFKYKDKIVPNDTISLHTSTNEPES